MNVREIEMLPEVHEAGRVLSELENRGISEPAIAAGWTRSLLVGGTTSDIDVSYVGDIHFEEAQDILRSILEDLAVSNIDMWDVEGIWNAQVAYGVEHTVDNFLLYYVDSIDSVYLSSDGRLHDPTGYGFSDATSGTLRLNMYDVERRPTTNYEEVNICLEACRRMTQLGWDPTDDSVARITEGRERWTILTQEEKDYFTGKLARKYKTNEVEDAEAVYRKYGWGFIFSEGNFTNILPTVETT